MSSTGAEPIISDSAMKLGRWMSPASLPYSGSVDGNYYENVLNVREN